MNMITRDKVRSASYSSSSEYGQTSTNWRLL